LGHNCSRIWKTRWLKLNRIGRYHKIEKKRYAYKNKTYREFKVGEHVILKMNPKKSSLKLGSCTKLAARFCGPFEILDIIGTIVYILAFPSSTNVHNLFHVFLMNKYVHDPKHHIDWSLIQEELE
jgi:hypothetical protein